MSSGFYIVLLYSLAVTVGGFLAFFGYRYFLHWFGNKGSGKAYVKVTRVPEGVLSGEVFVVFELPEPMPVRFSIQDTTGSELALVLEAEKPEGELVVRFDTSAFNNGDYHFEFKAPHQTINRKIRIGNT